MSNRLICICNFVDEKEIRLLLKKGAESTKDIQNLTRAGTSCGRCLPLIDELVAQHQKGKPKVRQEKLGFGPLKDQII
ncbi:MAG TPA: (2Fe-2S)-binding protein [Draconibacterium sp.]|jgi:bacterioferritin-associated ferredoxin|nr:(2Fe-2S)-binding protein [Draconibacterium sp.]